MNFTQECLVIPVNDKHLMNISRIILPIILLSYIIYIYCSKNYYNKLLILRHEKRSYYEIYINLILIWFLFGQGLAFLTTLMYTKSDEKFINTLLDEPIDELSIYMPRFIFDEIVGLTIRYTLWNYLWNFTFVKFNLTKEEFNEDTPFIKLNWKYILIKSVTWGSNIFISLTIPAIIIYSINHNMLLNSPLVVSSIWFQNLQLNCFTKELLCILFKAFCELIQMYLGNYIISYGFNFHNFLVKYYRKITYYCEKENSQDIQIYPMAENNYINMSESLLTFY